MSITINGVETTKFDLKQKEAKNLQFTYDVDITTASFSLVFSDSSGNQVISKSNSDFDRTEIADKIVKVNLSTTDLDLDVGTYKGELQAIFTSSLDVDKTETFKMKIKESIHS